jgi:hypothetical protein
MTFLLIEELVVEEIGAEKSFLCWFDVVLSSNQ